MRIDELDRVRGFAILVMVVDHVLVLIEPTSWVRYTVTRASMPLFALLCGSFIRGRVRFSRYLELMGWGLVLSLFVGFQGTPDILILLAFSMVAVAYWPSWWWVVLGVLQLQMFTFPWSGYQPGAVLALVALGRSVDVHGVLSRFGSVLPRGFGWIGRKPLTWYVVHLLVLGLVNSF